VCTGLNDECTRVSSRSNTWKIDSSVGGVLGLGSKGGVLGLRFEARGSRFVIRVLSFRTCNSSIYGFWGLF